MPNPQFIFLALVGGFVAYRAGEFAAGFGEMYYGEKVSRRFRRCLNFIIQWSVFATILLGALSLAWK